MDSEDQFSLARRRLVQSLRDKGIRDERVLGAIGRVPREAFLEPTQADLAYIDEALPIDEAQTISQPFTVATQTELLNLGDGDRVLEVGTGSGYQAAVLVEAGAQVFSIERIPALHRRAARVLSELGYSLNLRVGDGSQGWWEESPFDAILVTAATSRTPEALLEQLALPRPGRRGGRLVLPLGGPDEQWMTRYTRFGADRYEREEFGIFRFVPLIADYGGPRQSR